MGEHHGHGGDGHGHHDEMESITVTLECDQIEALEELAAEYSKKLSQAWDLSAVLRLAVGDFMARQGKIT
ncbi:MAG: hypothetical protein OEV59_00135 [Deltaproteobacteria bacterium]|nr:hypothetical protein [Deltaproteobacteria bacterium]